jgi:FAD:protein FMN transferase
MLLTSSVRRLRPAMGTWIAVEASGADHGTLLRAVEAAFAQVVQVERLMHPSREGSDLTRIRDAPRHTPVRIDRSTWEVLTLAKRVCEVSEGVFDPCLPERPGRLSDLQLVAPEVVASSAPVAVDLGGIGKGYAVDRAISALRAFGCQSALVNAGGDLRVFGPTPQRILLRYTDGTYRELQITDGALAVSEMHATCRPPEHRGFYLRAGTRPGAPCEQVAVLASEAAVADALTKCVLLGDEGCVARVLAEFEGFPHFVPFSPQDT